MDSKVAHILIIAVLVAIALIYMYMTPGAMPTQHRSGSQQPPSNTQQGIELAPSNTIPPAARNVTIMVYERDFSISPSVINVTQGENVTMVIDDQGTIDYGLNISGTNTMIGLGKAILPGNSLTFRFTAPAVGNYTVYSPIPGQKALGMKAYLLVNPPPGLQV